MPQITLYLLLAALTVAVAVLGYDHYEESRSARVEISIGENGVSIEGN